ncbi:hypothetical protein C8R41DRAFT_312586 [Lentinula lateritia]|uniref:CRIB domain-containing protein n=1 Tax=Lentinula lateritia TaxID=40482 RepID=A0ABQ8VHP0_9AGAR|nr:hypothetical protein C8R41DRAFT_312586 [Lentinula lateritia]
MDPSSSSSSSLSSGANKASRFSTLKVLGKLGKNKEKDSPPPPPPKDPYYLNSNRSFVSISTQYAQRTGPGSIHPASSTMSLASSATTADSDALLNPPSSARVKQKKSGFFSLKKRVAEENEPVKPPEDENISMPWNFQHNIHIDEGYGGMPPSWTVSLAEAGFTPDEIAAIYSRKQGVSFALDQTRSPAVLINPAPRSTSLPRQYSDTSLRSASSLASPPPVPLNPLIGRKVQQRSRNNSSSSHVLSISLDSTSDAKLRPNVVIEQSRDDAEPHHRSNGSSSGQSQMQKSSPLGTNAPINLSGPSTPPRRAYFVANANVVQSPPPAYHAGNVASQDGHIAEKNEPTDQSYNEAEGDSYSDSSSHWHHAGPPNYDRNVPSIIPLTPLTLPDIGSGLGLGNLGFDFDITLSNGPGDSSFNPLQLPSMSTVPPVVIDDTATKRTTITPSSMSISPVYSSYLGHDSSSLLAAPLFTTGPPASPTDPFPRSPSPPLTPLSSPRSVSVSEDPELPLTGSTVSTLTSVGIPSTSPHASGLFNEIQGMLAPGGMTATKSDFPGRQKKQSRGINGKNRDKELTPIERLRGYNGLDDGDHEDEDDFKDEGQNLLAEEKWTSPAISESLSPTLPPPSPDFIRQYQSKAPASQTQGQAEQREHDDDSSSRNHDGDATNDSSTLSLSANHHNFRNSSRSSTSTVSTLSAATVTQATRVTATSTVIQRALATKITVGVPGSGPLSLPTQYQLQNPLRSAPPSLPSPSLSLQQPQLPFKVPASPQSSIFGGSEEEEASASSSRMSGSTSTSTSSSLSPKTDTQTEDDEDGIGLVYYLDSPLPTQTVFDRTTTQVGYFRSLS